MAPEDNIGNLKVPPRGCGTCQHALWNKSALPDVLYLGKVPASIADHPCHRCSIGSSPVDWYPQYMPRVYQIEPQAPPVAPWQVEAVAPEPDLVFGPPPTPEAVAVEVGEPPQQVIESNHITAAECREYMNEYGKCLDIQLTKTTRAKRNNAGKPALSVVLTFPEALRGVARAAAFGEKKYDRYNYLKGAPASQSVNSTLSHLLAWWSGEEVDAESGLSHLDHFVWNALRLADELTRRPELDDRPGPLLMNGTKGT